MFDDLRQQASDEASFDVAEGEREDAYSFKDKRAKKSSDRILGMTPAQRFLIAVILLLVACLLSSLCLIVSGKIWIGI